MSDKIQRVENIIKPDYDLRQYRGLILSNQLRVLLISDSTTDKSAAAMCVHVGSLKDPWEKQGLAHLLEHVLFLQSNKYTEDNFLKSYITKHGGTTNASTSLTETIYYFDVGTSFLNDALDRFSSTFISPSFPKDKIKRELDSIQNEFESKCNDDILRCERIRKCVGNSKHVYAKFDYGNKSTLTNDDQLYKCLLEFYNEYYSSDNMGLAILGKESLDQLETMVVPMFEKIINKKVTIPLIRDHPYGDEYCRKLMKIVPFGETRKLVMFFPLPCSITSNSIDYLCWMLSHEEPNGLIAELKARGLCTSISARSPYYHGFGFFDIEVDLTQGVTANDQIITMVFQYIQMLKKAELKQSYNEIKTIKDIKFRYREMVEPINYVMNLCCNLYISMERCVLGRSFPEFVPEDIHKLLNHLTPKHLNIQVMSPIYKSEMNKFMVEPIFNIHYSVESISDNMLDQWAQVGIEERFRLPLENVFIPKSFSLKTESNNGTNPILLSNKNGIRFWFMRDKQYNIPKAFYGFFFQSNLLNQSPQNLSQITLFIKLYFEYINENYYSTRLVGISYNLNVCKFGLELIVSGYNDKLDEYALTLIKELLNFKVNSSRFEILRDIQRNQLKGFSAWPLKNMLIFYLEELITPNSWSYDSMLNIYDELKLDSICQLINQVIHNSLIEIFAHGNITKEESISLNEKVAKLLEQHRSPHLLNSFEVFDCNRDTQLDCNLIYEFNAISSESENNGFLLYYQVGPEELELRARLELFYQLIYYPFFNQIRSTEQLAYTTFLSFKYTWSGTLGLYILLQSSYELEYIEARIESFIQSVETILSNMSNEAFERAKKSLCSRLLESPKKLNWKSNRLWSEITSGQYLFDRDEKLVSYVKSIDNVQVILHFYKEYFQNGGKNCRKLIINIKGGKRNNSTLKQTNNSEQNSATKPIMIKRIPIINVRKFKCENNQWRISKLVTDHIDT